MLNRKSFLAVVAVGCAVAGAVGPASAQELGLRLEISSPQESYLVAEPVVIRMRLVNEGSAPVSVSPELAVETQLTSLFIAPSGGEFAIYDPGFVAEPSLPVRELAPGESIEHDQLVVYDWPSKDFAFPGSGTYQVKVVHHGFGKRRDLVSNVLEFVVEAPSGADAAALELFRRQDVAMLAMNLDEKPDAVRSLEALMTHHGESRYADYAQFYLARRETQEYFSRQPNPARAVELYEGLIRKRPRFVLLDQVYYQLGTMYLRLNDQEKAQASFDKVLTGSPDSALKRRSQRMVQKIRGPDPQQH